jgi:hypothetical protein
MLVLQNAASMITIIAKNAQRLAKGALQNAEKCRKRWLDLFKE